LELVHADIVGPLDISINGRSYFLTLVDDFSRYGWEIPMKNKSDTYNIFRIWHKKITNELGVTIIYLRNDNGSEFFSNKFKDYCNENGITQQHTVAGNFQQNGRAVEWNGPVRLTCYAY